MSIISEEIITENNIKYKLTKFSSGASQKVIMDDGSPTPIINKPLDTNTETLINIDLNLEYLIAMQEINNGGIFL